MQVYDSQEDMDRKEYRPAKDERSMQAAWALILDPRPIVHELGSVSLETVRKVLYKLYAHNFEAPEGFTLGRDVLLLSVIIGEPQQCKTKALSKVLESLGVYEGAGAYYVVIDTGLDRPTLHAGAYIEDGLETALTIAALVREHEQTEQEIELKLAHFAKHLEREERLERYERSKKRLDEAWQLAFDADDLERLNQLVDDTLELGKMSDIDIDGKVELFKAWCDRVELVQLRERIVPA